MERESVRVRDCPFCGNEAYYHHIESIPAGSGYDEIECCNCGISVRDVDGDKEDLIDAWNNRDAGEALRTIVQAVKAAWKE